MATQEQLNNLNTQTQEAQKAIAIYAKNNPQNPASANVIKQNTPINAADLGTSSKINVPPTPTPTAAVGALGQFSSMADKVKADEAAKAKSEATLKADQQKYLDVMGTKGALQAEQDITGKSEAVNTARQEVQGYNAQLIQEQEALRRKEEEIQKNPMGKLAIGVQDELNRTRTESTRRQADISLSKLVAEMAFENRVLDLNTANSIIQTKLDTELEPLKLKLQWNQYWDEQNKDTLTKSEQRQWEEVKLADQRKYDDEKLKKEQAYDIWKVAASNGAGSGVSSSILSAIDRGDYETAQSLATPYMAKPKEVSAPIVKTINGVDMQYNPKTGNWDKIQVQGDVNKYSEAKFENQEDLRRVNQLLNNTIGIKNTTGQLQSPKATGFFKGLISGLGLGTAVAPGPGTIVGGIAGVGIGTAAATFEANQTDNFLSDASYLMNTTTFDKLLQLKSGGATFGALSDPERVAIGRAANEFNAMSKTDEQGNVIGFRGSEKKLRQNLELIKKGFEAEQQSININYGLGVDDILEINSIK